MIRDIIQNNASVTGNERILKLLHRDFPQCFTSDGKFDLDVFQSLVAESVPTANEGYSLQFLGKSYATLVASTDTTTVIVPDEEHNSKPENRNSQNIYISGDNLDALKHLRNSYAEAVKCIYIDPPYNTGSDGFVYNDSFNYTSEELQKRLGISESAADRILEMTTKGSASHSAWLAFMFPRLLLARDLLTKDGVIFISIDDNEQANLKLLCDSVFGEENFLGEIVIKTATDNNATQINIEHEFMIAYAFDKDMQKAWSVKSKAAQLIINYYNELKQSLRTTEEIEADLKAWIKKNADILPQVTHYDRVDEKGVFSGSGNSSNTKPGGYMFDIIHPVTNLPCPKPEYGWRWPESTFLAYKEAGEVLWGKDHTTQPHIKKRIETATEQLRSVIYEDGRTSTTSLDQLFGAKKVFDNPKSLEIIKRILSFCTDKDSLILDFFSGSGTTAHAVMQLNAEDNGHRRFIVVQLPENLDATLALTPASDKPKIRRSIAFLDSIKKPHLLDEIGQERIRRAARQIRESKPFCSYDMGFKHFTLTEPNDKTFAKLEEFNPNVLFTDENIANEFGRDTILQTWVVRDGYGLNAQITPIKLGVYEAYLCGRHLYFVNPNLICKGGADAIVALIDKYNNEKDFKPENIVLFGYSFTYTETEALKKNLLPLRDGIKNLKVNLDIRY